MILVAGSTGQLGTQVCERLRAEGKETRALVRSDAVRQRLDHLRALGILLAEGDLKDPASLRRACDGADAVISTATSTVSRRGEDSIRTVDLLGQSALIDSAREAGISQFVYISFRHQHGVEHPLAEAKRTVERRLIDSGLEYTILQASFFMEMWLSPSLGFDPVRGKVRVYGAGRNKLSWVSSADVARFAVRALDEPRLRNRIVEIGGPEALSPIEAVRAFEAAGCPDIATEHISETDLEAQWQNAADPLAKTFAGLMLHYAAGDSIDMAETQKLLGQRLTSIRDFVTRTLSRAETRQAGTS